MDQLAPVFKWIKRNVFWLCCGFLSLAMIGIWFFASNTLFEQTSKRTREVKAKISAAKLILTVKPLDLGEDTDAAHPNSVSLEGMQTELDATIDSIVEAWTKREQAQQELLVWPKVIPNNLFVEFFEQYNPPETFPPNFNNGLQVADLLELYHFEIPKHMLYLTGEDLLRTRWNYDPALKTEMASTDSGPDDDGGGFGGKGGGGKGGGGMGGMGGGMGAGGAGLAAGGVDLNKYAVIWSDTNQDLWNQKLTMFQDRDDNRRETNDPTPLQCYMLQQDLWLLEAMFKIIREVNGNSSANDLSTIKNIDHVVFGREVGGKLGELELPDQRLAGNSASAESKFGGGGGGKGGKGSEDEDLLGMGGVPPGLGGLMDGDFGGGGNQEKGMGAGGLTSNSPYEHRYVDLNFEPLSAETVRNVITGKELPEENLELIVAKRVPVRIALRMDERKIAEFMAACANSPFAFEIQQVRWNRHKPGGEEIPLGGAGIGGEADKFSGMSQDMAASMGGATASTILVDVEIRTNYDVNVEFYGIVKIYNPVRPDRLRNAAELLGNDGDPGEATPRP